jgi:hypothetical protein
MERGAKALAAGWDAWGHRKLAELKRVGIDEVEAATRPGYCGKSCR